MNSKSRAPNWLTARPFAHRGLHDITRPENSLSAIAAAVSRGFGVELDVRLSADGQVMVFHDTDLKRLCGREERIDAQPASALGRVRLAQSRDTIPTLPQTLCQVAGKVPLLIEMKGPDGPPHALEREVHRLLQEYRGPAAVLSFNPQKLAWFAREAPEIIRGINGKHYGAGEPDEELSSLEKYRRQRFIDAWGADPDFFGYNCRDLPYWAAENMRQMGCPLIAWTVTSSAEQNRLRDKVDNIIFESFLP